MKNKKFQFKFNEDALIKDVSTNGMQGRSWLDLALQYNIRPNGDSTQRRKSANDVYRRYLKLESKPRLSFKPEPVNPTVCNHDVFKPKRLFYDIETSYNIVKSWRIGFNINLHMDDIIQERAIITIAFKWEGEDEVTVLTWDKGDDKKLLEEFIPIMAEADELIGHNVDRYDTKFILSRALKHNIPALPKYQSTDTLKLAKKHFSFNSNKLDYIAQYLGIGHKTKHRGLEMWDDIVLRNDPKALEEMIEYNVQDVFLTEKVYKKLIEYSIPKVNHASKSGLDKHTCPECGGTHAELIKTYITASGTKSRLMKCSCNTHYTISDTNYKKHYEGN